MTDALAAELVRNGHPVRRDTGDAVAKVVKVTGRITAFAIQQVESWWTVTTITLVAAELHVTGCDPQASAFVKQYSGNAEPRVMDSWGELGVLLNASVRDLVKEISLDPDFADALKESASTCASPRSTAVRQSRKSGKL